MPFALTTIGALFVIVGFQDTYKQFFTQLQSDFTGAHSFIYWLIAFGIVGSLGYIPSLKIFSRAVMALILVVMFIGDKGAIFGKFTNAIASGSTAPINAPGADIPGQPGNASAPAATSNGPSFGSTGSDFSSIINDAAAAASLFGG